MRSAELTVSHNGVSISILPIKYASVAARQHYVTAHGGSRSPPRASGRIGAGHAGLLRRRRFGALGRRGPRRTRPGPLPGGDRPERVVSGGAVALPRRAPRAVRPAPARGRDPRAGRSELHQQSHHALLLLQIGTVAP